MRHRRRIRNALLAVMPQSGQPEPLIPGRDPGLKPPGSILAVRPDHLGDLIFLGPALACLRSASPQQTLTLAAGKWAAEIASCLPGVDRVQTVDFPWFNRRPRRTPFSPYLRLWHTARASKQWAGYPFDWAIVFREDDWWSAWLTSLARIPVRAGHDRPGVRGFLTHALAAHTRSLARRTPTHGDSPQHSVAVNLSLAAAISGAPDMSAAPEDTPLRISLTSRDRQRAAALSGGARAGSRLPVAIHPGSGSAVKRYPAAAWRQVAGVVTKAGESILVTGTPGEADVTAELASQLAALQDRTIIDLTGRTDIGVLAALYERCRLVMGPDSGPLHLAVAVGTPTVHLFGPADARRFGPWGSPSCHRVVASELPCAPCHRLDWPNAEEHPCVRTIEAQRVVAAARIVQASCCRRGTPTL